MKSIREQLIDFLQVSSVTQADLSRCSGIHEVFISRLRKGFQTDIWSVKADALREAMLTLDYQSARKAGV